MQARLVTVKDGKVLTAFPVQESGTDYGRAGGNLVQIEDSEVSRRHFRVFQRQEAWHIQDLGSRNGTFVNGERVQSRLLQNGDCVRVGGTELVFIIAAEADLPVTGQAIDVSVNAYRQTMERRGAARK